VSNGKFLLLVQQRGLYDSQGEATHAINAVFSTIKSWISPAASNEMRKLLPTDASRLWQYSPVSFWSDLSPAWRDIEFPHLVLKIQQIGDFPTSGEAQRAYASVMGAVKTMLPVSVDLVIGKLVQDDFGDADRVQPKLETMVI
jgi:hypothetical protein